VSSFFRTYLRLLLYLNLRTTARHPSKDFLDLSVRIFVLVVVIIVSKIDTSALNLELFGFYPGMFSDPLLTRIRPSWGPEAGATKATKLNKRSLSVPDPWDT
jgi:hypothetical protein